MAFTADIIQDTLQGVFFIYCFFNSNVLLTPCIDAENETNENTNGLLREYFPKGSDLTLVDNQDHSAVREQT